jgi:hypothetical protein
MYWMQAEKWTSEINYEYADGTGSSMYSEWMMDCTKSNIT